MTAVSWPEAATVNVDAVALDRLVRAFGLTPFERDTLLLAVAALLDPSLPTPTLRQALDDLADPHWSAVAPDRPLRAAGLIRLGGGTLLAAPLVVDERVVHFLQGVSTIDERLTPYVDRLDPPAWALPPMRAEEVDGLQRHLDASPAPVLVHGPDLDDVLDVVATAAARSGRVAWRVGAADLPPSPVERDAFVRLWNREAALSDTVLVLALDDADDLAGIVADIVRRLTGATVVAARRSAGVPGVGATLQVARPGRAVQEALWRRRLAGGDGAARLAAEFDLGVREVVELPLDLAEAHDDGDERQARRACLTAVRQRLRGLAEHVVPRAGWDDLVLPEAHLALLRQFAAAAAGRRAAHERGAGRVTTRGLGVTALFAGPSGTGKTLAAEIVANELGLDLHRIDLAVTMSKWIGETEKQLRRVFDAAEQGGSVLLFDEADALFGKRTEVRDSHDRYANIEVSYLLQRMEQYCGVAILTTNLRSAIDPAFLRRLRFVVPFPHPDTALRRRLWELALAPGTVTETTFAGLAELDLTGGEITSIAHRADLLAAADGGATAMAHVDAAVIAEYAKLERPQPDLARLRT